MGSSHRDCHDGDNNSSADRFSRSCVLVNSGDRRDGCGGGSRSVILAQFPQVCAGERSPPPVLEWQSKLHRCVTTRLILILFLCSLNKIGYNASMVFKL
jgi:hypothetical protein